jgi:hypothetical protein
VDYDADVAEWLTAEQGSIEGWTWRLARYFPRKG